MHKRAQEEDIDIVSFFVLNIFYRIHHFSSVGETLPLRGAPGLSAMIYVRNDMFLYTHVAVHAQKCRSVLSLSLSQLARR